MWFQPENSKALENVNLVPGKGIDSVSLIHTFLRTTSQWWIIGSKMRLKPPFSLCVLGRNERT